MQGNGPGGVLAFALVVMKLLRRAYEKLLCRSYVLQKVLKVRQGFVQSNDNNMLGRGYGNICMQLSRARVYMNLQQTQWAV